MSTNALNVENGSTSKFNMPKVDLTSLAFITFKGGPKDGECIGVPVDEMEKYLPVHYEVIDAYVKDNIERYEAEYTGSLSWPDTTT